MKIIWAVFWAIVRPIFFVIFDVGSTVLEADYTGILVNLTF